MLLFLLFAKRYFQTLNMLSLRYVTLRIYINKKCVLYLLLSKLTPPLLHPFSAQQEMPVFYQEVFRKLFIDPILWKKYIGQNASCQDIFGNFLSVENVSPRHIYFDQYVLLRLFIKNVL